MSEDICQNCIWGVAGDKGGCSAVAKRGGRDRAGRVLPAQLGPSCCGHPGAAAYPGTDAALLGPGPKVSASPTAPVGTASPSA